MRQAYPVRPTRSRIPVLAIAGAFTDQIAPAIGAFSGAGQGVGFRRFAKIDPAPQPSEQGDGHHCDQEKADELGHHRPYRAQSIRSSTDAIASLSTDAPKR